jgi:hypothetical protein
VHARCALFVVTLFGLLAAACAVTSQASRCAPTPTEYLVPTYVTSAVTGPATATPTWAPPERVTPWPTITPFYSKQTDLAPDLEQADKSEVIVFRCDGAKEIYWVRPTDDRSATIGALALGPGDVIIHWYPPSLMGHQILAPTRVPITPYPTYTHGPYPVITVTVASTDTPVPYPVIVATAALSGTAAYP